MTAKSSEVWPDRAEARWQVWMQHYRDGRAEDLIEKADGPRLWDDRAWDERKRAVREAWLGGCDE
jgi:hypothetical protein